MIFTLNFNVFTFINLCAVLCYYELCNVVLVFIVKILKSQWAEWETMINLALCSIGEETCHFFTICFDWVYSTADSVDN